MTPRPGENTPGTDDVDHGPLIPGPSDRSLYREVPPGRAVILLGLYQVLIGTAILITPHWFSAALYQVWSGFELLVGVAFLLGGAGLLWATILPIQQRAMLLALYGLAAFNFGQMAILFARTGVIHGGVVYGLLVLGTLFLGSLHIGAATMSGDRLAAVRSLSVIIHLIVLLTGALMLLRPDHYAGPLYAPMNPWLPVFGTGFVLLGGALLARDILYPAHWLRAAVIADLLLAGLLIWWGSGFIATRAWTGVLTYALLTLGVIDPGLLAQLPGWEILSRSLGNSLRRRVALVLATVLVTTAVALTLALTANDARLAREDATEDDVALAVAVAEQLTFFLDMHERVVAQVADLPSVESMDRDRTLHALTDTKAVFPAFDSFSVVDRAGEQLVRTTGGSPSSSGESPYIQRALAGDPHVFSGVIASATGESMVVMAAPVRSTDQDASENGSEAGAVIGAVSASIQLPSISAFLTGTSLAQGREIIVFGPDGTVIAATNPGQLQDPGGLSGSPLVVAAQGNGMGTVQYVSGGQRMFAGYAAVAPYAWEVVVQQPETAELADIWRMQERAYFLMLATSLLLTALAVFLVSRLFHPVAALIEPLRLLGQGHYAVALPVGADGEIGDLVHAIERMRGDLHDREEERDQALAELTAEFERTAAVQAHLLPHDAPDVTGYAFAGICLPARHVGGDFFDWSADAALVHIVLGDVMGKGMPASLLTATVRAALRASWHLPAAQAVTAVNRALSADLMRSDSFITLFYAQLDPATGNLRYVDAGHGMALIQRQAGDVEPLRQHALPLGVMADAVYEEGHVVLEPGDTFILYSDGLPDARPDLALDMGGVAAQVEGVHEIPQKLDRLVALAVAAGETRPDDLTVVVVGRELAPAASPHGATSEIALARVINVTDRRTNSPCSNGSSIHDDVGREHRV